LSDEESLSFSESEVSASDELLSSLSESELFESYESSSFSAIEEADDPTDSTDDNTVVGIYSYAAIKALISFYNSSIFD